MSESGDCKPRTQPLRSAIKWPVRVDLEFKDTEVPQILEAARSRVWIVRGFREYGAPLATLYYWPGEIGDGSPIALRFDGIAAAQTFYALNVAGDGACCECYSEPAATKGGRCVNCETLLRRLSDAERRYKAMTSVSDRRAAMWKRVEYIGNALDSGEATEADKAAVLDQLMRDVAAGRTEATASEPS